MNDLNLNTTNLIRTNTENPKTEQVKNPVAPLSHEQQDSFTFSKKANKKTLSEKQKIAIGTAIGTAFGIGIGILAKKKIDTSKLSYFIKFKPAKNIDEAIEFTKKKMGINCVQGFIDEDLEHLNWINEGLTFAKNKTKGKVIMPRKLIMLDSLKEILPNSADTIIATMETNMEEALFFGRKEFKNARQRLTNHLTDIVGKEKLPEIEKMDFTTLFKELDLNRKKANIKNCITYNFTIAHELGHLQHRKNTDFKTFKALCLYNNIHKDTPQETKALIDLFKNSQDIVEEVSEYAKTSPNEFVADTYAKMITGQEVSKKVLDLYKKLYGPEI